MAELVRLRNQVLAPGELELFARYQSALDNRLNKALRALREAQAWRLQTLEATELTSQMRSWLRPDWLRFAVLQSAC